MTSRTVRELNQYITLQSRDEERSFLILVWRAPTKKFYRIGVARNYRAADLLMRADIRRRYRRRYRRRQPPIIARCDECQRLTRVGWFTAMCFDCCNQLRRDDQFPPDDDLYRYPSDL